MTTQELNSRLKSLSEALREASSLITKLSKLSAPSNSSSPHPGEAESRVELSAEVHQSLKEQEEDYDLLKQEVEDLDSGGSWASGARRRESEKDRERITLLTQLERLGEDLKLWVDSLLSSNLLLIDLSEEHAPNSARLNCRLNATKKLLNGRSGNSSSQAYKRAAIQPVLYGTRATKRSHRTTCWSTLLAT